MKRVKVVTDSTADIPDDLADELEIGVVHDYINFGTQSLRDKLDISRTEFYNRLVSASEMPTTASPSVGEFEVAFRNAGAPEVSLVSLHPSAHFSALYNTACLAAQSFPEGRITVVDTGQVTMGMGWQVIAAARAAQAGATLPEIVELVTAMRPRAHVVAALDTFEFLRRSGRVGWAKSIVGTLLHIKPMIEVQDGQIYPLDRVRTTRRAMARLVELTAARGPLESLAVLHTNWPDGAAELRRRVARLHPGDQVLTMDVTPVIGVHVGPKGLGIATIVAADSVGRLPNQPAAPPTRTGHAREQSGQHGEGGTGSAKTASD
jgi:DegV family protein with EDD domain